MISYFRACEKQQTISNVVRFNDIKKSELLKKCWLSIQASVTNDCALAINAGVKWLVIDDYVRPGVNGIVEVIDAMITDNTIEVLQRYPMSWIGQGEVLLCKVNR